MKRVNGGGRRFFDKFVKIFYLFIFDLKLKDLFIGKEIFDYNLFNARLS